MKRTLKTVATVALAGFVVASCSSLNKMKRLEKNIAYKVTPEMLEAKGGQVDLKIDATIPAKYFNKKVTLVATPVLKFQNGGEKAYDPKTFQGEKVQGNNEVVPYATEKTVNYSGTVPFEEGMRVSGLYVKFQGSKGKKSADYESRKIADGVIATATMVNNAPAIAIGADQFERITKEEQEAAIYYLINSAQIRTKEMSSKEIKAMEKFIKDAKAAEDMELKNIQIQSYASPDGPMSFNENLANNREGAADKFVKNNMKKNKVEEYKDLDFFKKYVVAEDWEGFKKAMEESNIRDKELILRVLAMYSDPEVREREIKNISSAYSVVAEQILPKLRRSKFVVNAERIGKSDEEIRNLAKSNPSALNVEELLYAATLFDNNGDKLAIYEAAMRQFPNDWPLAADYNNNAVSLAEGDIAFWFNGNWAWAEMSDFAVEGSEYGIMPVAQPDSSNGAVDKLAGGASKYCMIDTKYNSEAQQQAAKDFLNWLVYDENGQDFLVNQCSLVPAFSNNTMEVTNPMGRSVQSYANEGNLIPGYPEYPGSPSYRH